MHAFSSIGGETYSYMIFWLCLLRACRGIHYGDGEATVGQFPSTVAIVAHSLKRHIVLGSGTLIHPQYVLAAPRWLHGFNSESVHTVVAGDIWYKNGTAPTRQVRRITHYFDRRMVGYPREQVPLEMYRVESPFYKTRAVKFAKLSYETPRYGWAVEFAGFGHAMYEDGYFSPVLRFARFQVVKSSACLVSNPKLWGEYYCIQNATKPRTFLLGCDAGGPVMRGNLAIGIATWPAKWSWKFNTVFNFRPYKQWIALNSAWDGHSKNIHAYITPNTNLRSLKATKYGKNLAKTLKSTPFRMALLQILWVWWS